MAEGVYSLNLSIIYSNSKALSCCPHWRECAVWTITCFLFHNSNLILLNKRILECCLQTSFSGLLPWAKRNPEFPCILVTLQYFVHSHHWSMKTGGQFFYPEMCSGAEENPLSHNIGFFTMLEINENNCLTLHFSSLVHSIPISPHRNMVTAQFWAFHRQGTGKDQMRPHSRLALLDYPWTKLQECQYFRDNFSTLSFCHLS